jgi:hypothetical protein
MSGSLGSIVPELGFLNPIIQDNTLVREFRDALFPELLYRSEALPEKWEVNVGDTQIFTRASLLAPAVVPLLPGADPVPGTPSYEQWKVIAAQYSGALDTHMPSSRTALAPLFVRNAKTLGLQAGQSLNRGARNRLFCAYTGGDTITNTTSGATTTLAVASINGFTITIVNGQEVPVSSTAPKIATVSGVAGTVSIIAATPTSPLNPFGPGTLTLSAAIAVVAGARVLAQDAPRIVRVGAAATVDGLSAISAISLREIRESVALMRRNRVPTHTDGYYHVHMDPLAMSQIFSDNEFQRLNQGVPEGLRYAEQAVGMLLGCIFFSNSESPNVFNSSPTGAAGLVSSRATTLAVASPEYYAEVRNASGVALVRTIITGGGAIMEKFIDEAADYMTEAGYTGKVGEFSVVNNGIQIMTERIRYIIRSPQDRLQQQVSQAWSWSGDWGVPTDLLGGLTGGRYKRAVVIESGSED